MRFNVNIHHVIKRALVTEKASFSKEVFNQYAFEVQRNATKNDIKRAIEELFKVGVVAVRTQNLTGKWRRFGKNMGRTSDIKKALVQLKEGDKIEIFEGV
jgi:large subunit ribosomal protein L23